MCTVHPQVAATIQHGTADVAISYAGFDGTGFIGSAGRFKGGPAQMCGGRGAAVRLVWC